MAQLVTIPPAGDDLNGGLERAARELRAAVIASDHARAEGAVHRYVQAVRQNWEALPELERGGSSIPAKACELLAWARQMTLIQRNLAADQHHILQKASRYHGAVSQHQGLQVKG
ncbi:MAG TPA: hypothetical protein VK776_23380 [Bryobacteraceae bacterium]|nr:hypothetical protein [Bryobacteraceae bacterium]